MKERRLATIQGVRFGVGDYGKVCMWFAAHLTDTDAALQVLSVADAVKLIKAEDVRDCHELNGRQCWVLVDTGSIVYDGPQGE